MNMNDRHIDTIKGLLLTIVEAIDDGSIISNNEDYLTLIHDTMDALKG